MTQKAKQKLGGKTIIYGRRITSEVSALGRHAFRLREGHAGDAPGFDFPVEAFRQCSQLIRALSGQRKSRVKISALAHYILGKMGHSWNILWIRKETITTHVWVSSEDSRFLCANIEVLI